MLNIAAIRRAIEDVERAVAAAAPHAHDGGPTVIGTLARLYGVYAQGVLQQHGISVDLDELCAQCCRQCPEGRCVRDEAAG